MPGVIGLESAATAVCEAMVWAVGSAEVVVSRRWVVLLGYCRNAGEERRFHLAALMVDTNDFTALRPSLMFVYPLLTREKISRSCRTASRGPYICTSMFVCPSLAVVSTQWKAIACMCTPKRHCCMKENVIAIALICQVASLRPQAVCSPWASPRRCLVVDKLGTPADVRFSR